MSNFEKPIIEIKSHAEGLVSIYVPVSNGSNGVEVFSGKEDTCPVDSIGEMIVSALEDWADSRFVIEGSIDAANRFIAACESGNAPNISNRQRAIVMEGLELAWSRRYD